MSPLELSANAFNLLSVWFSSRNNMHTWWCGIVGCVLHGLLFVEVRLYADVTLQAFFVVSCIVGWWNWTRGRAPRLGAAGSGRNGEALAPTELPISRVTPANAASFAALAVLGAASYGWLLHALTDAASPFVDATVLALSILAQLLMVARKLETWLVWFVVDCFAVPLYGSKGLWLTATVYAFFRALVVAGWFRWTRLFRRQRGGVAA